jgi:hypothetical protein
MDLNAVDVSKDRCYNCNKIGHLSNDCTAPQKIKFNLKQPDKGLSKPSLNLIDLNPLTEETSNSNLFAIETVIPRIDLWAKINDNFQKISDNLLKRFDKSIAVLNQQLWEQNIREIKAKEVCKRIESKISPPRKRPLVFIPGAARHGITRELELSYMNTEPVRNSLKRKHIDLIDLH